VPTTGPNAGAIETPLREVGAQMSGSVLRARIPGRNVPAARIAPPAAMNSYAAMQRSLTLGKDAEFEADAVDDIFHHAL